MLESVVRASLILVATFGAEGPTSPPTDQKPVVEPAPARTPRHFVVQIQLIEVDEQGQETVLGEPRLKTAGGNAGVSIDHPDGRRFDFTVRLTDRIAVGSLDALIPAPLGSLPREEVHRKLDQKLNLDLIQVTRREALREVSRRSGVSMAIEPETIRMVVHEMEAPIDFKVSDQSVSQTILQLIEPMNLTYVVRHDVVVIGSADARREDADEFVVRTYNVADLIQSRADEGRIEELNRLADEIRASIRPESWKGADKAPAIRPFQSTGSLVVRQTPAVHGEIVRWIARIRQERPRAVSVPRGEGN